MKIVKNIVLIVWKLVVTAAGALSVRIFVKIAEKYARIVSRFAKAVIPELAVLISAQIAENSVLSVKAIGLINHWIIFNTSGNVLVAHL